MKKLIVSLLFVLYAGSANTGILNLALTDKNCMVANLFFEARGKGAIGMQTVADVTINRAKSPDFPDTICGVVFQRKQFSWTHQIPKAKIYAVMQGKIGWMKPADQAAFKLAEKIAVKTIRKGAIILPKTVMFYHTPAVRPKWARKMKKYGILAGHIMYHTPYNTSNQPKKG